MYFTRNKLELRSIKQFFLMLLQIKYYMPVQLSGLERWGLRITNMPNNVIKHYKLTDLATPDGYVYCKIQKGMYGVPHARIIAQQLLETQLQQHGYRQSKTAPGL